MPEQQIQIYANKVGVDETETEMVLDFHFAMKEIGKNTLLQRIILPKSIAAKLGILLAPVEPKEESNGIIDSDNRSDNNRATKSS